MSKANPSASNLFYSTYDFSTATSREDLINSEEESSHDFKNQKSTRGLDLDFPPTATDSYTPRELPGSRLWSNTASMFRIGGVGSSNGVSKGWKAHQSEAYRPDLSPTGSLYDSQNSEEEEDYSEEDSPPSFLTPLAEERAQVQERKRTIHVYPAQVKNRTGEEMTSTAKNRGWVGVYFLCLISVIMIGFNQWLFLPSVSSCTLT